MSGSAHSAGSVARTALLIGAGIAAGAGTRIARCSFRSLTARVMSIAATDISIRHSIGDTHAAIVMRALRIADTARVAFCPFLAISIDFRAIECKAD